MIPSRTITCHSTAFTRPSCCEPADRAGHGEHRAFIELIHFLFFLLLHSGYGVPRAFSDTSRLIFIASPFLCTCKSNKTPAVRHAYMQQSTRPGNCPATLMSLNVTEIRTPPLKPMARLGLSGRESFLSVLYMEQDQGVIEGGIFRPLGAQQIALLISVSQLPAVSQA